MSASADALRLCGRTCRVDYSYKEDVISMRHIQTIETRSLCESAKKGGCGECQTSCQSACKTSCGIANQQCENKQSDKQ